MDISLRKRVAAAPLVLLVVALGTIACMVLADTSAAAVPPTGLNCVALDGKISGRGATYQNHAEAAFAQAYRDDFCGNTPGSPEDVAGNTMLAYNYPAAESISATGAGAGLRAASCRTDAYAGSSLPYSEAQFKELNEAPGKLAETEKKVCSANKLVENKFTPPFQPLTPAEWPSTNDTTAPVMSFPIAGSAVTLPVDLTAATCGGTAPTSLSFNAKEASRLLGGDVAKWSDAELVANNPSLSKCTENVVRVLRPDSAGTTEILKSYLVRSENERTGQACAAGKKWNAYTKVNTEWPGKQKPTEEGTCSSIVTAASSGGAEEIKLLKNTPNGVGYADLADAAGQGLIIPNVQNSTGTAFVAPNIGKAANCTFNVISLPGVSSSDAVGLNSEDNWGTNNEINGNPNHENATDLGTKYPICGITFDLVYTGLDNGAVPNPISRLSADQRRTLYSYFSFVLSSAAQDELSKINYAALPSAWLPVLREGFQNNF
jgi:ABC-type phosphate transport system substrate-binding protein